MDAFNDAVREVQAQTHSWTTSEGRYLLILDYDGTLTPIVHDPKDAILSKEQHAVLESLASHPLVQIWIVSGRDKGFLSSQFQSPKIALVAEHGAFWRKEGQHTWVDITAQLDFSWVPEVQRAFDGLCTTVPGTRVESKAAAIVWHWRANQHEGSIMAPAVQSLLQARASRQGWKVKATTGKCIVEVRPETITKGGVVRQILQQDSDFNHLPKHIFCAGDDATDEGDQ